MCPTAGLPAAPHPIAWPTGSRRRDGGACWGRARRIRRVATLHPHGEKLREPGPGRRPQPRAPPHLVRWRHGRAVEGTRRTRFGACAARALGSPMGGGLSRELQAGWKGEQSGSRGANPPTPSAATIKPALGRPRRCGLDDRWQTLIDWPVATDESVPRVRLRGPLVLVRLEGERSGANLAVAFGTPTAMSNRLGDAVKRRLTAEGPGRRNQPGVGMGGRGPLTARQGSIPYGPLRWASISRLPKRVLGGGLSSVLFDRPAAGLDGTSVVLY